MNIYEKLDKRELLDFSQNYVVDRNYLGNALFPNRKTDNLEVEWMRLEENGNLPTLAPISAWDTEAQIAERIPLKNVTIEQLLIKEKINMTERLNAVIKRGTREDDRLKEYAFDDAARRAEAVIAQTEALKMQVLATGKVAYKGNGLSVAIDYGIPSDQKVSADWSAEDADIIGDIRKWRKIMVDKGTTPNRAVTSESIVYKMQKNKLIQTAIFGAAAVGVLPTLEQLNALLQAQAGITITTNDARYAKESKTGQKLVRTSERFFPENTFSMISTGGTGSFGTGIWGVTPEEDVENLPWETRKNQFITISQWKTPDPVAVWTMATAVFVPIVPNPYGLVSATIKTEASV